MQLIIIICYFCLLNISEVKCFENVTIWYAISGQFFSYFTEDRHGACLAVNHERYNSNLLSFFFHDMLILLHWKLFQKQ
jgi:hypothetical protein